MPNLVAHDPPVDFIRRKYGDPAALGPNPQRRLRFGYLTPDDHYECLVDRLVTPSCRWLDVGGGRNVFPSNPALARELADRCGHLTGVDPSPNIHENPFAHERVQSLIEDYTSATPFDLLTLRMVAEHITNPVAALGAMHRLLRPGGTLVIYTINKWAPVSVAAWAVPFGLHHPIKKLFWGTEAKDTFSVAYRMNTRRTLRTLAEANGFRETAFRKLDDLATFQRFRPLNYGELISWKACRTVGLTYPENCLLGVYERV